MVLTCHFCGDSPHHLNTDGANNPAWVCSMCGNNFNIVSYLESSVALRLSPKQKTTLLVAAAALLKELDKSLAISEGRTS